MPSVLIVSDLRVYREGLAGALHDRGGVTVVGSAWHDNAVARTGDLHPEVVLIDLAPARGLRTVRSLRALGVGAALVVLAAPGAEGSVIEYARAGIDGCVTHESSLDEVQSTVEAVARGEKSCSPLTTAMLLSHLAELPPIAAPLAASGSRDGERRLTPRELQIVGLLQTGLSNKEIAGRLCIELSTVKNHVHNVLDKLRIRRRTEIGLALHRSGQAALVPEAAGDRAHS